MKLSEVPRPKINRSDSEAVKELKRDGPKHLKALLERSIIFAEISLGELEPDDLELLGGGMNAVAYLVRRESDYVVAKFDLHTMKAEAEALTAWWHQGAKVVAVKSHGISPLSKDKKLKVKYLILEGVTGSGTGAAEVAIEYAQKHPSQVEAIGRNMGRQLALMHRATTKRTFGEFADSLDSRPYASWNAFLMGYVKYHHQNLLNLGYSEQRIRQLRRYVRESSFPRTGRYLHGDFSMRNALIESRDPLKIRIIDPNPVVGNIHWDMAVPWNNAEMAHRRASLSPGDKEVAAEAKLWLDFWHGVNEGYRRNTKRKIERNKLALHRLVQMIFKTVGEIERTKNEGKSIEDDIEVVIRRNILSELMLKVLG